MYLVENICGISVLTSELSPSIVVFEQDWSNNPLNSVDHKQLYWIQDVIKMVINIP